MHTSSELHQLTKRAGFQSEAKMHKEADWVSIMNKAKRLIQSGQVQVLRNGFNYIVGHIIGDHGEYDTEVSRDSPDSRTITGWQCSCPWDQYAWQRTRKWKKFEGRPCSHVMALYWKALSTPLDEQLTEEQANAMGTGQKLPAPAVPDHPPEIQQDIMDGEKHQDHLPRSFGPEGDINQGDQTQLDLPPDAIGHPPGPAQAPLAPPPSQGPEPPGILPPFPGEQMQMQWAGPGTTPGGQKSPPGAYSVPGAKPPGTPPNPIQGPGTFSHIAGAGDGTGNFNAPSSGGAFQPPQVVRLKNPVMGLAEGPEPGQYGDGEYQEIQPTKSNGSPTLGEVLSQDATTGWIEAIFPLDDTGYHAPFHVRCFVEPSDIEATGQTNAFIRRH